MANLDSASKRISSVQVLKPFMVSPPLPDSTLDQGDRQHIAFTYSGILAAAPGGAVLISQFRSIYQGIADRIFGRIN